MEDVILVDTQDNVIGTMEKLEAHRKGILHRAFSILIFNSKGEVLLQKRSKNKYHSGGLWTNACCSHPLPHESMYEATKKRLKHEMGIDLQPEFAYKFLYKTNLDNDLIEHEYDHVFTGKYDGMPTVNIEEVEDWKFIDIASLRHDLERHPDIFTEWFKLIMNHHELKEIPA